MGGVESGLVEGVGGAMVHYLDRFWLACRLLIAAMIISS
jgi:hypothetical protein